MRLLGDPHPGAPRGAQAIDEGAQRFALGGLPHSHAPRPAVGHEPDDRGSAELTLELGALVLLEAEHTCMTLRGVRKEGSRFVTWAAAGAWKDDALARREILDRLTS